MTLDRSRFESALPATALTGVVAHIVGLGNLGSALSRGLAQMGVAQFYLMDPDEVEEANVSTQAYDSTYVGWDKVEAARSLIRRVEPDASVVTYKSKIEDAGMELHGSKAIVIAALDSIEARKTTYQQIGLFSQLYIDPRMALEDLEVTFLRVLPGDGADPKIKEYEKSLDETDHLELPCSARSLGYTGAGAAGLILPQVRRWILGLPIPYVIHANLGAGVVKPIWRKGEKYTPEEFAA